MEIVRCSKCGKYIHKATQCYHCCNSADFHEVSNPLVHKNVAQDYVKMEILINDKKYNEAISLSYRILEWMPFSSSLYWLRLLAKNNCSTAIELIRKGFPCDTDSDFLNALDYSTGEEHDSYRDIQNAISDIRTSLKKEIRAHKYNCIKKTNIINLRKTMQSEIDRRKQDLFSSWYDLEAIEQSLSEIEADCRLLIKDHQESMENAVQEALSIKKEVEKSTECTAYVRHSRMTRMGSVLQQYTSAKDSILRIKAQHPWVKDFQELVSRRNAKEKALNSYITDLQDYEQSIQSVLNEIVRIETVHENAYISADQYRFLDTVAIIGPNAFDQILHTVGVGMGFTDTESLGHSTI